MRLYDSGELAALLGVRRASFRRMRASPARYRRLDGLPAPVRQDPLLWDASQVDAWLASKPKP